MPHDALADLRLSNFHRAHAASPLPLKSGGDGGVSADLSALTEIERILGADAPLVPSVYVAGTRRSKLFLALASGLGIGLMLVPVSIEADRALRSAESVRIPAGMTSPEKASSLVTQGAVVAASWLTDTFGHRRMHGAGTATPARTGDL